MDILQQITRSGCWSNQKKLNDILSKGGLPIPVIVKIDPESFDLKVLPGASDLFGKTDIFQKLRVSVVSIP
jgi:hypothetical protein